MFTPEELRSLITCAGPQLRAMILLALNAGLGNNDLAQLCTSNLQDDWLDYPRPKTGIGRRVPLWRETREALAAVIRPDDDVVFRTKQGNPWTCKCKSGSGSPISQKFTKLCQDLKIHKLGRGFYSLRHVAQTIGEESGDHVATKFILGHAPPADDMSRSIGSAWPTNGLYGWLSISGDGCNPRRSTSGFGLHRPPASVRPSPVPCQRLLRRP